MGLMTWFGHPSTWLLLFAVWLSLGALMALVLKVVGRVSIHAPTRGETMGRKEA